MVFVDNERT
ncbi:hypothetical protein VCHC56A2_2308, partial [Vibrio cholerae HC-56A2]